MLSANLRSFVFLGDNFILGSTLQPPALLVYGLDQSPADGTAQASTHLLRFLFGHPLQDILLASDPSPGWSSSFRPHVPFLIAGDERIIAMNEQFFDDREVHQSETFLIPTKTLLRYIEALPIKEGHDVDWETYDRLLGERVPWHGRWDIWTCFVFGMRYILPRVVSLNGKSMVVIHDLSPRRCLRASKEERKESNALYQAMMERSHRKLYSYPRSLLKCVSLPEGIEDPLNVKLMLGEDGIVVLEEVRHRKTFIFVATRLMRLGCRPLARARQPFIFSRSDVWDRFQLDTSLSIHTFANLLRVTRDCRLRRGSHENLFAIDSGIGVKTSRLKN